MTREEALQIIKDEKLQYYNWFAEHEKRANEVAIIHNNGKWSVFTTDERECVISEVKYDSESDALKDFIERLRASKMLRELGYY